MSDWYLLTQLNNFKHGIRGADKKEIYGPQMALISEMLRDDQLTRDILAYINTFK